MVLLLAEATRPCTLHQAQAACRWCMVQAVLVQLPLKSINLVNAQQLVELAELASAHAGKSVAHSLCTRHRLPTGPARSMPYQHS